MIYLDSAATTFQKPPAVGRAMIKSSNTVRFNPILTAMRRAYSREIPNSLPISA